MGEKNRRENKRENRGEDRKFDSQCIMNQSESNVHEVSLE